GDHGKTNGFGPFLANRFFAFFQLRGGVHDLFLETQKREVEEGENSRRNVVGQGILAIAFHKVDEQADQNDLADHGNEKIEDPGPGAPGQFEDDHQVIDGNEPFPAGHASFFEHFVKADKSGY